MDSMLNKAKEAAGKYTGHGDSHSSHSSHGHKDESTLHHIKHEEQKMAMRHAAKDYAEDHGFSKKNQHHDNQDESLLDKAKEAVGKYTGHGDSHSHKKDNQDEFVLDKAREMVGKYTGHGDSHKKDKHDDDSIFDKAKDAVEKYTKKH